MDDMTMKCLKLDLENLTEEERKWLHKMKNLATAMSGQLQMKHLREEIGEMEDYGSVHRKHMQHEVEHQDKEWRRLNVVDKKDWYCIFLEICSWVTAIGILGCFGALIVHWWPK